MEEYRTGAASNLAGAIRSPYGAAANVATIVRRRNENYFRTPTEPADEMLQSPCPDTYRRNARRLSGEGTGQREAFGTVANEARRPTRNCPTPPPTTCEGNRGI